MRLLARILSRGLSADQLIALGTALVHAGTAVRARQEAVKAALATINSGVSALS